MIIPTPVVDILHRDVWHNTVQAWLLAALTAAIVLFVGLVLRRVLAARLTAIAARTETGVDDMVLAMVAQTRGWMLVAFALFAGLGPLTVPVRLHAIAIPVLKLLFLLQLALWGVAGVRFWLRNQLEHRTGTHDRTSIAMLNAIGVGAKALIWTLIVLMALRSVFDVEITALITGLGVSGIAVALAVQNILADVLAALAIVFDKPFDVGDGIGVDDISGTVEHIGLKTTRIRAASGEQIIIGNGDLLKSRIHNYRRQQQRRIVLQLDVPYGTAADTLERIPGMVHEIIEEQNPVKFDRAHVSAFMPSAIRIEAVYYVLDPDYGKYMDIQQAIALALVRRFARDNIDFALPSQTLHHEGLPEKGATVAKPVQSA